MLVRPAMKMLFCLKAKNGLGRFAPSALPHYNTKNGLGRFAPSALPHYKEVAFIFPPKNLSLKFLMIRFLTSVAYCYKNVVLHAPYVNNHTPAPKNIWVGLWVGL